MSYTTGEDLIVAQIKAHANFNSDNVSQADWGVLNSGKSDHYAITKSGGETPEFISPNVYVAHQRTIVEVWQRYKDDGDSATNLYGYVANVRAQMQNAEKLGDTGGVIQNSGVEEIGEVEEMWGKGGGPAWIRQNIIIAWDEQVATT